MIKKLLSLSDNLFTKTVFLTFAFRSKCGVNKSTSCKKQKHKTKKATRSTRTTQKHVIAAEAITFCIKPLTRYFPRSDLKFLGIETAVTQRNKMPQNFILWKAFVQVKIPK